MGKRSTDTAASDKGLTLQKWSDQNNSNNNKHLKMMVIKYESKKNMMVKKFNYISQS